MRSPENLSRLVSGSAFAAATFAAGSPKVNVTVLPSGFVAVTVVFGASKLTLYVSPAGFVATLAVFGVPIMTVLEPPLVGALTATIMRILYLTATFTPVTADAEVAKLASSALAQRVADLDVSITPVVVSGRFVE